MMLCFILSIIIPGICKVRDEFKADALRVLVVGGREDGFSAVSEESAWSAACLPVRGKGEMNGSLYIIMAGGLSISPLVFLSSRL